MMDNTSNEDTIAPTTTMDAISEGGALDEEDMGMVEEPVEDRANNKNTKRMREKTTHDDTRKDLHQNTQTTTNNQAGVTMAENEKASNEEETYCEAPLGLSDDEDAVKNNNRMTTSQTTRTTKPLTAMTGMSRTTPATTLRNNQNSPLDDTMAQAVETLQIGPTNVVMPEPTSHTAPWTLVPAAYKKAPTGPTTSHPSQEYGLVFERTTKGNNWSTDDLLLVLQTIQAHDPKAMLSSADNKTKPTLVIDILRKAQKDTLWFTKFTAMKTMTWGKPSDGTTKIVFSFWLTSTIIKKDLAQLRMDSDLTEMLKGTNTYMKVTKLLEPHGKIVGYFLGKDIIHTNRDDITNRLAAHITKYSQTIWTPALDVLNTTVLGKGHNTRMVTLVVGNSDYQGVLDILTQQLD